MDFSKFAATYLTELKTVLDGFETDRFVDIIDYFRLIFDFFIKAPASRFGDFNAFDRLRPFFFSGNEFYRRIDLYLPFRCQERDETCGPPADPERNYRPAHMDGIDYITNT